MNQFTAIYSGSGELVNSIKYYDGFMGQRVGAISCLAFHPHWVCLLGWAWVQGSGPQGRAGPGPLPTSTPKATAGETLGVWDTYMSSLSLI